MKTLLILLTTTLIMTFNSPEASDDFNIQIEDETYIDDIPFNTENVLHDFGININPVFPNDVLEIEPEKYINDIPFKTKEIFENYLERKSYNSVFQLKEESYIDDIPFCTNAIFNSIELCKKYTLPESEGCKNFTFSDNDISK